MKVCHLAFNTFLPDARIYKEAETLANAGHDVTVLAFRRGDLPAEEMMGPVKVRRLELSVFAGAPSAPKPSKSGPASTPTPSSTSTPRPHANAEQRLLSLFQNPRLLQALTISRSIARVVLPYCVRWLAVKGCRRGAKLCGRVSNRVSRVFNRLRGSLSRLKGRVRKKNAHAQQTIVTLRTKAAKAAVAWLKQTRLGKTTAIWLLQRSYLAAAVAEIQRLQPDVVHAHDLTTLGAGIVAARLVNARLIYDAHEMEWECNRIQSNWVMRMWWRFREAALISAADGMVTVSPRIGELYRRRYNISPPVILPNVPREDWMNLAPEVRLRDLIPQGDDKRILLNLGNVTADRGLPQAIRALRHLPEDYVLATLGNVSPTVKEQLHGIANELGVRERFFTFPPVHYTQVANVAADADVGLVLVQPVGTSYEYCMPNKLFELMHAGVPMVVGDLPDVKSIVVRNQTGLVCDQQCAQSIAHAVLAVQDAAIGSQSPEREQIIRRGYSWEAFEPRLLNLYASTTARPRRRRRIRRFLAALSPRTWWLACRKGPHPVAADNFAGLDPAVTIAPPAAEQRQLELHAA